MSNTFAICLLDFIDNLVKFSLHFDSNAYAIVFVNRKLTPTEVGNGSARVGVGFVGERSRGRWRRPTGRGRNGAALLSEDFEDEPARHGVQPHSAPSRQHLAPGGLLQREAAARLRVPRSPDEAEHAALTSNHFLLLLI